MKFNQNSFCCEISVIYKDKRIMMIYINGGSYWVQVQNPMPTPSYYELKVDSKRGTTTYNDINTL